LSRRVYLYAALLSALYFTPFLRLFSHNGDEGTLIDGAVRVTEGQLPLRDFFEVMGPGTFYWLALFFKLLGTSWLTTRIFLLVVTTGIVVLLYYLSCRLPSGGGAAPVIFFVAVSYHSWNAVSHHLDSNLFGLAAFAALTWWIDTRRHIALWLAGAGAALTTAFMLQKGALLAVSFVAIVYLQERRRPDVRALLATLIGGGAIAGAAMAGAYGLAGGLSDWIYTNISWPLAHYSGVNVVPYGLKFRELYWDSFTRSMGIAGASLLSIPFVVVLGLPLVLAAFGIFSRRDLFNKITLPYWCAGAALWISEMHRKDVTHIVFGSPLIILLAYDVCARANTRWLIPVRQFVTICALLLALLNPLVALNAPYRMATRRGDVRNAQPPDRALEFLISHTRPGEDIFVYPYSPMYYFLAAANNPTRYSILMYGINTPEQFREVTAALEVRKVRYVLWDRTFPDWIHTWFPSYREPSRDNEIVEPYLTEHYRVAGTDGRYQFLERK
jgi:hypothetical protein